MRWPLQPLQPFQQTQLQPPFSQSVASLCHPWFTTTNFSYRFPIFETSATALCGTTGIYIYIHIYIYIYKFFVYLFVYLFFIYSCLCFLFYLNNQCLVYWYPLKGNKNQWLEFQGTLGFFFQSADRKLWIQQSSPWSYYCNRFLNSGFTVPLFQETSISPGK